MSEHIAIIYLGQAATEHVSEAPVSSQELRQLEGYYRDPSTSGIWTLKVENGHLIGNLLGVPGQRLLMSIGPAAFSTANGSFKARFDVRHQTVQISEYGTPATTFSRVQLARPLSLDEYRQLFQRRARHNLRIRRTEWTAHSAFTEGRGRTIVSDYYGFVHRAR